jgi:dTDP-4-amino-4,6-dideoxygalactose transaminase
VASKYFRPIFAFAPNYVVSINIFAANWLKQRVVMRKISMVDLKSQYEKIKTEIDNAINEVINSSAFINGPAVKGFQTELEKYLGVKHVIPCANGTDALQISMMALGLKPGDEVIAPTFTFIATAEVISLLGLTPVLVDVDADTFNISPDAIAKAITPKTKAIVPVHLFGQCADMDAIMKIAGEHNLFVIEDACQSLGSDYHGMDGNWRKSGTIGNLGCTSFFPSKNLGCFGDGGAVFTNDDALAAKIRVVVNHGMTMRYYHDEIGVNSRLDSIQAAVLKVKLNYLDSYVKARQHLAEAYSAAFGAHPEIVVPAKSDNSSHVFHQYTLQVKGKKRDRLQAYLAANDIPAMVYYPVPIHLQKAYRDSRYKLGDFPVAEQLIDSVISLPMHTEMDEEQIAYITSTVLGFFEGA